MPSPRRWLNWAPAPGVAALVWVNCAGRSYATVWGTEFGWHRLGLRIDAATGSTTS